MFTVKMKEVHGGAPSLRNTVPLTPVSPGHIPLLACHHRGLSEVHPGSHQCCPPTKDKIYTSRQDMTSPARSGWPHLFLLSARTTLKYRLVLLSELLASAHPATPPRIAPPPLCSSKSSALLATQHGISHCPWLVLPDPSSVPRAGVPALNFSTVYTGILHFIALHRHCIFYKLTSKKIRTTLLQRSGTEPAIPLRYTCAGVMPQYS